MKILLLCLSFFFLPQEEFIVIEDNYTNEVILEEIDLYQLVLNKEAVNLFYNKTLINSYPNTTDININIINEKLIVTYLYGNKIYLSSYKNGLLEKEKVITDGYFSTFGSYIVNEKIYLFGGVKNYYNNNFPSLLKEYHQNINCFIMMFDLNFICEDIFIFGGYLDEFIEGLRIEKEIMFIWGQKESLTGGDLGNAGLGGLTSFLCSFSWEEKIINQVFFNDEIIKDVKKDLQLIILTNKAIHNANNQLEVLSSHYFPFESFFSLISVNNLIINIESTQLNVYSSGQYIKLFCYEFKKPFTKIFHYKNKLITSNDDNFCEYRLYDLRKVSFVANYEEAKKTQVYGLDTLVELKNIIFEIPYQSTNWGLYPIIYDFFEINIAGNVKVDFYCNVLQDRTYPYAYELKFNGTAYLDGVMVVNSHMIQTSGYHSLKILSLNNEEREIGFFVDRQQITFEDYCYDEVNLRALVNTPFSLPFKLTIVPNTTLEKVIINNKEAQFVVNNGIVLIQQVEKETGYYCYYLEELHFSCENRLWVEEVNYKCYVIVGQDAVEVDTSFVEDYDKITCLINISDLYTQLRGINLIINDENGINNILLPYKDQALLLTDLNPNTIYQITLALAYELGGNNLQNIILFQLKIKPPSENYNIGEILIVQKSQSIEKMQISLNKAQALVEIKNNTNLIYNYQPQPYWLLGSLGLGLGISIFSLIYYFRFIFKRNITK